MSQIVNYLPYWVAFGPLMIARGRWTLIIPVIESSSIEIGKLKHLSSKSTERAFSPGITLMSES